MRKAPFEIHTNYWGGIIEDPEEEMDGVTSIEVYGYATPEPDPAKYYIVGSMNSWGVDENYEMNPSLEAETEEYFYTLDLTTTSEFKVVKVQNGQQSWIPEGMGNNYGQNGEITEDGEYTVYFRPNFDGGENWFYSCIYAEKTGEFVPETPTYYLVGNMTEWDVDENYELNPNIDSDIEEYFYVLDLTTTNQFKVVKVQNGQQTWYPSGMDNNYGQNGEITEDGEYTIYFRPNYNGGDGWFYNCLYVTKNEPEPQPAASDTITWDMDFCSEVEALCDDGANIALNNSKDGITVTYSGYDDMDGMDGGGIWLFGGSSSKVIFSSAVGDISKIEVYYYDDPGLTPPDWTLDATNSKFVWEGTPAASVDMMRGTAGNIGFMVDHIVFIVESQGGTTSVENVQTNKVQGTKILRDGMLLIVRDGKIYNVQGVEIK